MTTSDGIARQLKSTLSYDAFSYIAFIVFIVILPLFFLPVLGISVPLSKAMLISFVGLTLIIVYLVGVLMYQRITLPRTHLLTASAFVIIATTVSSFFSGHFSRSFFGYGLESDSTFFIILGFVFLLLATLIFRTFQRVIVFYGALVIPFLFLWLLHAIRFIFGADALTLGLLGNPLSTIIGNWNDLSIYFGMIAVLSFLSVHLLSLKRQFRMFFMGLLGLSLVGMLIAHSIMVWQILAAIAALFFLYDLISLKRSSEEVSARQISLFPFIIFLVALLGLAIGNMLHAGVLSQYTQQSIRPSVSSTLEAAKVSFSENPFFGVGPNRFAEIWPIAKPTQLLTTRFADTIFTRGFGTVPSYIVVTGIIGLLAWITFFFFYLKRGFAIAKTTFASPLSRYFVVSSFLLSLYLWSFVLFSTPGLTVWLLAFITTGVCIGIQMHDRQTLHSTFNLLASPRYNIFVYGVTILLVALALIAGYFVVQSSRSYIIFQGSTQYPGTPEQYADVERANSIAPLDLYKRSLVTLNLARVNEFVANTEDLSTAEAQETIQTLLGQALGFSESAIAVDNENYQNWVARGDVYAVMARFGIESAYEQAVDSYNQAGLLNPKSHAMVLKFAALELGQNNLDSARQLVGLVLNQRRSTLDALFMGARIEAQDQNVDGVIQFVQEASLVDLYNQSLAMELGVLQYNNDRFEDARASFERSVILNPGSLLARYFLGLTYRELGEDTLANEQFEFIRANSAGNEEIEALLSDLDIEPIPETTPQVIVPDSDEETTPTEEASGEVGGE